MSCRQKGHRIQAASAFILSCLTSVWVPVFAQDGAKISGKWLPKNGIYAAPGADLGERCMDQTEVAIELADKSISGEEWNCKINKRSDMAPNAIKLDAVCADLDEKPYKVVFVIKKIDEKTILYGASTKTKTDPGEPMAFCPEDGQRRHNEAKAITKAEAEQKAAQKPSEPVTWK